MWARVVFLLAIYWIGFTPTKIVASEGFGIELPILISVFIPPVAGNGSVSTAATFAPLSADISASTKFLSFPITWTASAIEPPDWRVISALSITKPPSLRAFWIWVPRMAASASNAYDSSLTIFPANLETVCDIVACCTTSTRRGANLASSLSRSERSASAFRVASAASALAVSPAALAVEICLPISSLYFSSASSAAIASRLCETIEPVVAMPITVAASAATITDTINQKSHHSPLWPRNKVEAAAFVLLIVSVMGGATVLIFGILAIREYRRRY